VLGCERGNVCIKEKVESKDIENVSVHSRCVVISCGTMFGIFGKYNKFKIKTKK